MSRGIPISGLTLVSALGRGWAAHARALRADASGLTPEPFADGVPTLVGRVAGLDAVTLPRSLARYDCRNNRLALLALESDGFAEAVARVVRRVGPEAVGLIVGTSTSGIAATEAAYRTQAFARTHTLPADYPYRETHNVFATADFARQVLGLQGPAVAVSTACSSSAKALAAGARWLRAGVCRAVVVGGVDSLCATTLYGFRALDLLARGPVRPFSAERCGIAIGEAGGFALLTTADLAAGEACLTLAGAGESADGYHMTAPHPEGLGAYEAMAAALAAAGRGQDEIDYIALHGTGTVYNDAAEDRAIARLGLTHVPAGSNKGALGHTLGAAGLCALATLGVAMREGFVPGTVGTRARDPALSVNLVLTARPARLRVALLNTFGFGGSNCSLVVERAS